MYPLRGVRSCPNTLSVKTCSLGLDLSKVSYNGHIQLFLKINRRREIIYYDIELFLFLLSVKKNPSFYTVVLLICLKILKNFNFLTDLGQSLILGL